MKELEIPEKELVKESPDDGVQNLGEYKEALYEKPENVSNAASAPAMPDVPSEPVMPPVKTTFEQESKINGPAEVVVPKMPDVPNEPVMPDVPTSAIVSNAGDIGAFNPATAWANVLNVIESVPAKFFYSGVGKLVSVQNNKITLGFVNENAINQAKSESKFKHLTKAINTVLGENWVAEFILITENIQTLDVKLKPQAPARPNYPQAQMMFKIMFQNLNLNTCLKKSKKMCL